MTPPGPESQQGGPVPRPPSNTPAVAALVAGILSCFFPIVASIPAIILGHIARGRIRRAPGQYRGAGLATIGLVLGYLTLLLWLGLIGIVGWFFHDEYLAYFAPSTSPTDARATDTDDRVRAALEGLPPDAGVELKVRTIIATMANKPTDQVRPEDMLLKFDLDEAENREALIVALEAAFQVNFGDRAGIDWKTVRDVVQAVESRLGEAPGPDRSAADPPGSSSP